MKHLVSILALLLAVAPRAGAEVVAREGKGYLEKVEGRLVLHVKGSPFEMGYQHGKLLAGLVRRNVEAISDNKGPFGRKTEYKAYKLMRHLMHARLRPHVPARFVEEMKGLAKGSGIPYPLIEASNLFPEAFHCSGIALRGKATRRGVLLHVRILDYMTRVGLQETAVVIVHEPARARRWINVGFAGFIGTVTGMNEDKVAIGEMGGRGLFFWDGVPMAFLIRDALERAGTLREAVGIFRRARRTCEYYYVISDGKSGDARGIWATPEEFHTARFGESFGLLQARRLGRGAAAGKAFLGRARVKASTHGVFFKSRKGGVEGFIATPPADVLVMSGPHRYLTFMKRLDAVYGNVDEKVLMQLIRRPVSMKSNLHCAIFRPSTLEVWVAVAAPNGDPACNQPYYRYRLEPARQAP